jgi:hypothetical protein
MGVVSRPSKLVISGFVDSRLVVEVEVEAYRGPAGGQEAGA